MRNYSKKYVFFYFLTFSLTSVSIVFLLEIFSHYMIYQKGKYLKIIDNGYYLKLTKEDPPYQFTKNFYVDNSTCSWLQNPDNEGVFRGFNYPQSEFRNEIKINSLGFRSSEEFIVDNLNVTRIAFLGDSFLQALQVREQETLSKIVEKNLLDKEYNIKTYNFGITSTGTVHQYQIFFNYVGKIKPNVVILAFFPNDLIDNSPYYPHENNMLIPHYGILDDGTVIIHEFKQSDALEKVNYSYKNSHENGFINNLIDFLFVMGGKSRVLISPKFFAFILADHFLPKSDFDPSFDVYKKDYPEPLEESFFVTIKLLKQLYDYCHIHDIEFLVVLLPAKEQVEEKKWHKYISQRRHILKEKDFDIEIPNRRMNKALDDLKIPNQNLLPIFKKVANQGSLFYDKDMHFNQKGHQRAGEAIGEFLIREFFSRNRLKTNNSERKDELSK